MEELHVSDASVHCPVGAKDGKKSNGPVVGGIIGGKEGNDDGG